MYDRIMLGFDDSEQARDALTLTRLLASAGRRSIVVSHVVPRPPPFDARTREYVKSLQHRVRSVLDPAIAALSGLNAEACPIESRSTARGLLELAEEQGASLIVIGSTHRSALGRVTLGSVGEILLAASPTAVAVAPRGFAAGDPQSLTSVSVGFNGAPEGRAALRTAARFAAEAGARLRAIIVDEGFLRARHSREHHPDAGAPLEEQLDGALAEVDATDADRILLRGSAATRLAEACAETDLLVVGSRSYGPLHHALLGSVSAKLMRSCPAPLLVVPRAAATAPDGTPAGAAGAGRARS